MKDAADIDGNAVQDSVDFYLHWGVTNSHEYNARYEVVVKCHIYNGPLHTLNEYVCEVFLVP